MNERPLEYSIRPLTADDEPILWEMLYQGLQTTGRTEALPRESVRQPDLARYVEEWGREGDIGFVAFDPNQQQALGAVWCRTSLVQGNGLENTEPVPELALAVRSDSRRKGVGVALLTHCVRANPQQSAVRLRVSPHSPAVRLYERFGFRVTGESAGSVTMRR
ncbi:MAG TPA: GNAT family N-acetyltransferase [Chthoniobacterales bacterium]|nr:GNAT family N-acetyltransferase [Chthoniobacterales bacterium]